MGTIVFTCILSIIFFSLIGILINNLRYKDRKKLTLDEQNDKVWQGFIIVVFSIMSNLLLFGITIDITEETYYRKTDKAEIVSVNREAQTEGKFFLGSGYIEGKQYFISYKKVGDNSYKLTKIDAERTTIHETDSIKPSFQLLKKYKIKHAKGLIFDFKYKEMCCFRRHYDLYVPKNTIVRKFELN